MRHRVTGVRICPRRSRQCVACAVGYVHANILIPNIVVQSLGTRDVNHALAINQSYEQYSVDFNISALLHSFTMRHTILRTF